MTLLKIAQIGHPVLRRVADRIADPAGAEITRLVADMIATMHDAEGVGLAAPQVYASVRVIVFVVPDERRQEGESPGPEAVTALINPVVEPLGGALVGGLEGCLSIPRLRGIVPRFAAIRYRGHAPDGSLIEREATGFHARVVQHEMDHLDGILFLDRMHDLTRLATTEEAHHLLDDA